MSRRPEVSLPLPPLDGETAWNLADALEALLQALCQEYGNAMADYQGRRHPDLPAPPDAVPYCPNPAAMDPSAEIEY